MKHSAFAGAALLAIVLTPAAPAVAMPFASTTTSAVTAPTSSDLLQVRYFGRGHHYGWGRGRWHHHGWSRGRHRGWR